MPSDYDAFFHRATGQSCFPYQRRMAELENWPDLLEIPTGLGKTAAVTLAWLWKRCKIQDPGTPRRLVWCLPMRVLVEQTCEVTESWIKNLGEEIGPVGIHALLGGSEDLKSWAERPEDNQILVGTQDMLLSRALMRGYGASRYLWPVHFAFLHNDALWVYDEVQLMGAGLVTSAQLEAFRHTLPMGAGSRTLWMSATLNREWLGTVDFRPHLANLVSHRLSEEEGQSQEVRKRREAIKTLKQAGLSLIPENSKGGAKGYAKDLAALVRAAHRPGTQTLVILNTVDRAQAVFRALGPGEHDLLVHARFRQADRQGINASLRAEMPPAEGRIVVATQAIEAGVDITSRALFTELAPWSSLVQRFGRCNRYGEHGEAGAEVFWIDVAADQSAPYEEPTLASARAKLLGLGSASPAHLPATDEAAPLFPVLRRRDFLDLFNTDPDLSGFDTDIAIYIRDTDDADVQIFWRDLTDGVKEQPQPSREEICRASWTQINKWLDKRKGAANAAFVWDPLAGEWAWLRKDRLRPGLTILLDARLGGYDRRLGFLPEQEKPPVDTIPTVVAKGSEEAYDGDHRSRMARPIALYRHLADAEGAMRSLAAALGLSPSDTEMLARADRWHDVGKAHEIFQATMTTCEEMAARKDTLWAKSPCRGRHKREGRPTLFRHELASMLAWLIHQPAGSAGADPDRRDLIAYLIAAHHGKVRMSLRALPKEQAPVDPTIRFARGVWEGDSLPPLQLPGEAIPEIRLTLDLMELGEGAMGPSWTDRAYRLLATHGPFRLAWLEALVRIADWRASRIEQEEAAEKEG
jgi:CRISPR-associated endonuclease/helicase Cas3